MLRIRFILIRLRIRLEEKWIRIRLKIEKMPTFVIPFLLITQKMIVMLFYEPKILKKFVFTEKE